MVGAYIWLPFGTEIEIRLAHVIMFIVRIHLRLIEQSGMEYR
jgi:hypothetical protein